MLQDKGILGSIDGEAEIRVSEGEKLADLDAATLDPSSIYTSIALTILSEASGLKRVLIPLQVVEEFEDRAKHGDELGLKGLRRVSDECAVRGIEVSFEPGQIRAGDAREAARELARVTGATLVTCDPLSARSAEAMGLRVAYRRPAGALSLDTFFTGDVMSVHLKEGVVPRIKKGAPGRWTFEEVGGDPIAREELESLVLEIMAAVQSSQDGSAFVEIDKPGSTIVQLGDRRIVIARPPFSDGMEITAVRPVIRKSIEDYRLSGDVLSRIGTRAEGILIAGSPGMGKSTFAQALAEFYKSKDKVVKTVESPRDLQLPPDITQYSKTMATPSEIHDVLLLGRPDYTIFDELRSDSDFELFIDLRLAGIGMVGVVHATSAIDAVQRFVHRVDLGLVPSIIDTILFIDGGEIVSAHVLETEVKIPIGLARPDLARPTVIMRNLMTGRPEYELYVFGEKTFVVPVGKRKSPKEQAVRAAVEEALGGKSRNYTIDVSEKKIKVGVPAHDIRGFTRKTQKNLFKVGRKFGLAIEVEPVREYDERT